MSSSLGFVCSDVDAGDSKTYSTVSGTTNADMFTFATPTVLTLSNVQTLDFETVTNPLTVIIRYNLVLFIFVKVINK